jgi:flagellar protein FlbD
VIPMTRLDGSTIVVNADLIETVERTGETVITLVSGTRFVVREDPAAIVDAVLRFRAGVLRYVEEAGAAVSTGTGGHNVIPLTNPKRSTETD